MKGSYMKLAKRYAKALFEAVPRTDLESFRDKLLELRSTWLENPELQSALLNPAYPLDQRIEAAGRITESACPNMPQLKNLVMILLKNKRIQALPDTAVAFDLIYQEFMKEMSVKVTSAFSISADERTSLESSLRSTSSGLSSIEWDVDPSLIGGLKIQVGDKVLDNTVSASLRTLRDSLNS